MNPPAKTVAVCITTHNRRKDLTRTLAALGQLAPPPDEVLVAADGCTDGTVEMIRDGHPEIRLLIHSEARGSIPSRNELAEACASDIFVNLDDDSYPMEPDFIARVRILFEERPRLAVATFPQRSDESPETLSKADFGPSLFVGSFADSGAAIRSAAFRELGGFPDFFFHMYEEPDFALRCVCAGWQVFCDTSFTVRHHFTGVQRNEIRTHHQHARNEVWSLFLRCPAPQCAVVAIFRVVRQAGYAWSRGWRWLVREPAWWIACLRGLPRCFAQRNPLPWRRYLAWMHMALKPIANEKEWLATFGKGGA